MMYTLSVNVWFQKLIRQFFFAIDKIVFNFIPTMYDLLISIARTSILTQADILDMANRVYKFLALFMVFKVVFSLITYVVNPDEFTDKSKGLSKLGLNIIISLSLLVITPYLFRYAYQIQTIILEDNSLAVLIFGEDKLNKEKSFINSAGDDIAYITMMAFYSPDTSLDIPGTTAGLSACTNLFVKDSNGLVINEECFGIDQETISGITDVADLQNASKGLLKIATIDGSTLTVVDVVNYANGVALNNLGLMFRQDLTLATDAEGNFVMEYKYLFSTIMGVIIILLLITFCMDVGLRNIKLAFYQLMAPIPILSYIDPKSGKDGMFKKWYTACFKTFLSLFVRLLALYFAVYIISRIRNMTDIISGAQQTNFFVQVFIIIGALMFAKDFPKILEGIGIKLDGSGKFFLNPFKKFGEQAYGGKQILGLGAATTAAGAAFGTNLASRIFHPNSWKDDKGNFSFKSGMKNIAKAPGSAIAGAASAFRRGGMQAMKGEKPFKIFTNSYGSAMFAKVQREDLNRKGSTILGRFLADANRITGNLNAAQLQELNYASLENDYKAETQTIKKAKDALGREKAITAQEKARKIKTHNDRKMALSKINERISTMKDDRHANVKDADELVNNMKANGTFYVKIGEKFALRNADGSLARYAGGELVEEFNDDGSAKLDADGRRVTHIAAAGEVKYKIADASDVAKREKSESGFAADKKLTDEKIKAFDYLKRTDDEVKNYINLLHESGVSDEEFTKPTGEFNKAALAAVDADIGGVNSEYYTIEQDYDSREKALAEQESVATNKFTDALISAGIDKETARWIANEANNASRAVKSPQPEGFKPTAQVSPTTYSAYNTGLMLGSGPAGGGRPGGPPVGGPPGGGPRP